MHPPTWLGLSLALLPSTVTAFYPYHFGDDSKTIQTRRISPGISNIERRSLTLPLRRVPTPLRPRQNTHNIANSNDPEQPNSVAIDQDGGDLSYMVAVTIGDSKEEYHLLLDSAASNTWVMGQDCRSEACQTHNTFGKENSGSLKTQSTPFDITYGTGSVSGTLGTETMHIGPLSPSLTFGLATNVSADFVSYAMDGILGIGRGTSTSTSTPQLMDVLVSAHLIPAKIYGVHLSRSASATNDGELNFGEVNKNRFTGDLNWLDVVDNDLGFWEIQIDGLNVNSTPLILPRGSRTAIIDTGTSFILVPPADALLLHQHIPGSSKLDGETFSVPCDSSSTLSFSINKQIYEISSKDWRGGKLDNGACRSNIIGRKTFGDAQWLVGDVFLKNVYSVFDFDGKRVGLGVKREGGNAVSSSSKTSASATGAGVVGVVRTSASGTVAGASSTGVASSQGANAKDVQGDAGRVSVSFLLLVVAMWIAMCA